MQIQGTGKVPRAPVGKGDKSEGVTHPKASHIHPFKWEKGNVSQAGEKVLMIKLQEAHSPWLHG